MHHLPRTRLALLGAAALAAACSPSSSERAPNPLATMRLTPAASSATGVDVARVLDRDTTTGATVAAPATVTLRFTHAVQIRRVKAIGAGVRVSADGASVDLDGTGWRGADVAKPFWTDALTLSIEPSAAGARLDEVEVWGAGLVAAPRDPRAIAAATRSAKISPFEDVVVVRADGMPAKLAPAGLKEGAECVRAALRTAVPVRQVRRAYLAYEANVQRAIALRRSLDGAAPVGGFWLAATSEVRTLADELDPEQLTGDDSVLLCLPDDATGAVTLSGLRLLLVTDDGRDVFDRDTRLAFPEVTDGDPATAAAVHAVRVEAAFDRLMQVDEAELGLAAAPARLSGYGAFDGQTWSEQGALALDGTRTPLPLAGAVAQAAEVTFAGSARTDVPAAGLSELAFCGSGVGPRVAVPRLVLTSPGIRSESGRWVGERFDGKAYVAGWAESPDGPGTVTVDGAEAGIDGAFGVEVARPQGATGSWDVVVRARFPGGAEVTRTIHLDDDRQSEILQGGATAAVALSSDQRFGREDQTQWGTADGDGGTVTLGTEASIDVPAGALSARTALGISRKGPESIPQLEAGMINVTAPANSAYRFLPKGQKFAVPARITLPYDPSLLPEGVQPEEIRTYYFDEQEDRWIALTRREVVRATQRVLSETTHFTFMINAVLVLPDHPGPASFNPNSIKDLAAASPSAGIDLVQPPDANAQGSAQLVHPIRLPKARGAHQPDLRLAYDSSGGNGWAGIGWDLPVSSVQLDTRWGVPEPTLAEPRYLLDGAQLVPTGEQATCEGTTAPGALFRERIAREFKRVVRCGTYPDIWFEVSDRAGTLFVYGFAEAARLRSPRADRAVGQWFLERVVDLNGNLTEYGYDVDARGPADATEGEPFVQVYLRSIRYTGRAARTGADAVSGGTPGPYVVDVYATTDGGALATRSDTIVSGRLGFKVLTRRLLGRVRVSLDPGSSVAGQSGPAAQPIRDYELDYGTSALGKSRVRHVRTYGFDASGQRSLFYEHGFEYEDPDVAWPFGHETMAWSFDDQPDDDQAVRSQEKSKSKSGGLSFGIGIFSLGGSVSKTKSTTSGETVFADLNGDGLPDRIYRAGSGVSVAQFNGGLPEGATAGHFTPALPGGDPAAGSRPGQIPVDLGGGYGSSKVKSARAAVLFVGAKLGSASGTSISNAWTADMDGDGFLDMVTPGGVLFGNPRTAVAAGFSYAPGKLSLPLQAGGTPPGVDDGRAPSDAVLEWIAPYDGKVHVDGSLALVDRPRPPTDPAWDGVRLRIYRADDANPGFALTKLYETTTDASKVKTPEKISLNALEVASGTRLYFVLSTMSDFPVDFATGSPLEETQFAPVIAYVGATPAQKAPQDPMGAPSHLFDSAPDFRLASGTPVGFTAPVGGTVRLSTTIVKAPSGDDVRLCVQKYPAGWQGLDHPCAGSDFVPNGTGPVPSVVDLATYASTAARSDSRNIDVQITRGEQLVFRIESDLAIDPAALSWEITGSMTQVCDETPTCRATTPPEANELSFLADPFFPPHVAVEPSSISGGPYSALPAKAPLAPFVAPASGTLQIVTRQGGWSPPQGTFISARTKGGLVFKSGASDPATTITIAVQAGDRIYFEGHGETTVPAGWTPTVTLDGTPQYVPVNLTQDAFLDVEGKRWQVGSAYGGGYHGWRRGTWHRAGSEPFDPGTFLVLLPYVVDSSRWLELETKLDDPQSPESLALAANGPLYPRRLGTRGSASDPGLKPDVAAFVSPDRNTFVTATTMHGSIEETVSGVEPVPVYPGAVFARRSDTDSKQVGMDVTVLGVDQTSGKSWQSQEAIDLNGDRVVDGIFGMSGATAIALTPIDRSAPRVGGYGGELLQKSSDGGTSVYVGGHVGMPKIGGDSSVIQAIVGAPSTDSGVALSANLSTVQNDLVDVNGDGLPDRVSMPAPGLLVVELNLGGKFGAPDVVNLGRWDAGKMDDIAKYVGSDGSDPFFKEPERVRRSVAVTLQSSVGASFVVGVGRSWESSLAATEVSFVDVTGDGLPDYVRKGPNDQVMYVRVNTGHGFGER